MQESSASLTLQSKTGSTKAILRHRNESRILVPLALFALFATGYLAFRNYAELQRLEHELADAQTQLAQLQSPVQRTTRSQSLVPPRELLRADQIDAIAAQLGAQKGSHQFRVLYNCADGCRPLIDGIRQALHDSGWREQSPPAFAAWPVPRDIVVSPPAAGADQAASLELVAALQGQKLPASEKHISPGNIGDPTVTIYVGPKTR